MRNSFTYLAMLDYPYPASFLAALPASPVNVACQMILNADNRVAGLAKAAGGSKFLHNPVVKKSGIV